MYIYIRHLVQPLLEWLCQNMWDLYLVPLTSSMVPLSSGVFFTWGVFFLICFNFHFAYVLLGGSVASVCITQACHNHNNWNKVSWPENKSAFAKHWQEPGPYKCSCGFNVVGGDVAWFLLVWEKDIWIKIVNSNIRRDWSERVVSEPSRAICDTKLSFYTIQSYLVFLKCYSGLFTF